MTGPAEVLKVDLPVADTATPRTLRELAAIIEWRQEPWRQRMARARELGIGAGDLDRLADMRAAQDVPTVGWWRRALHVDERLAAAHADVARLRDEWNGG
jgi:hypothetical protein